MQTNNNLREFSFLSFDILTVAFLFFTLVSFVQPAVKEEKIKVSGNCGMCRAHIVKAATDAGASYADWNKTSKILTVKYDASKTSNLKIQEEVAKAGYDTKDMKADDKAYQSLDACCKYKRTTKKS